MKDNKSLVLQIKSEALNLLKKAQNLGFIDNPADAESAQNAQSSRTQSTKPTRQGQPAAAQLSSVGNLQKELNSLSSKLKYNDQKIVDYFNSNYAYNKLISDLKTDNKWWVKTNNSLKSVLSLLGSLYKLNSDFNLGIQDMGEVYNKMNELLSGYEIQEKTGKVLLADNEKDNRAKELLPIIQTMPAIYSHVLASFRKKYGNIIYQDADLDDYSGPKKQETTADENSILNNTERAPYIDIGEKASFPLRALVSIENFKKYISGNPYGIKDEQKQLEFFDKIKAKIDSMS